MRRRRRGRRCQSWCRCRFRCWRRHRRLGVGAGVGCPRAAAFAEHCPVLWSSVRGGAAHPAAPPHVLSSQCLRRARLWCLQGDPLRARPRASSPLPACGQTAGQGVGRVSAPRPPSYQMFPASAEPNCQEPLSGNRLLTGTGARARTRRSQMYPGIVPQWPDYDSIRANPAGFVDFVPEWANMKRCRALWDDFAACSLLCSFPGHPGGERQNIDNPPRGRPPPPLDSTTPTFAPHKLTSDLGASLKLVVQLRVTCASSSSSRDAWSENASLERRGSVCHTHVQGPRVECRGERREKGRGKRVEGR